MQVDGAPVTRTERPDFSNSILKRLEEFLPRMKKANEELGEEIGKSEIVGDEVEDAGDGRPYIEMNLGLGLYGGEGGDEHGGEDEIDGEGEEVVGIDGMKGEKTSLTEFLLDTIFKEGESEDDDEESNGESASVEEEGQKRLIEEL
ncbi:hypothetical protein ROZALSC1DRAFT_30617 [Rozella allomycis CSF55]|uniref:Uncharacterized protein n=1 Tax=Rozella allomycis (strain CSF55) TaxID=988480 RepID=A0A4P9YE22_ROZAC|nr:hypothetical protein ROZALSC1DRAFT_30617 [Rozella allomycis CSF55]